MINKPFYNALHYPSLMPFKKKSDEVQQVKMPNMNVNKEVFNRLYDHAVVDNNTKMMLRDLHNQSASNMVYLNKKTGGIDIDGDLQRKIPNVSGNSRSESASRPLMSSKKNNQSKANDSQFIKPRSPVLSNFDPKIKPRSNVG